jgi:sulfate adenylyltransferase
MDGIYPQGRVAFGFFSTMVRYAGPREAILQAIIRRNYGCSHFIIGRDHSGVGGYYEKYAAHDLAHQFEGRLGIEILCMPGPYYCSNCRGIVTEETCPHSDSDDSIYDINATDIRRSVAEGVPLDPEIVRSEVLDALKGLNVLADEKD